MKRKTNRERGFGDGIVLKKNDGWLLCLYTARWDNGRRAARDAHGLGRTEAREERAATSDWILTWNSKEDHDRAQVGWRASDNLTTADLIFFGQEIRN